MAGPLIRPYDDSGLHDQLPALWPMQQGHVLEWVAGDDQQIRCRCPERTACVGSQGIAAQVHERLRLQQTNLHISEHAGRYLRIAVLAPCIKVPARGEMIHDPPAHVVTRPRVFATGIAESDDEFHD